MTLQALHCASPFRRTSKNLDALIRESVLGLSGGRLHAGAARERAAHVFGIDTRLIEDGTYFVVEDRTGPVACGGWSRRRTASAGDRYADRSDDRLDPETEPARIRAFFVHP